MNQNQAAGRAGKTSRPSLPVGRYFKYAIGEIVLVMVGILLALQVSNWNEKRKETNSIENLLNVFQDELIANINSSNSLIKVGYARDSALSMYKNNKLTPDILRKKGAWYLSFETSTRQFRDDNLNELIEIEKKLPEKYKSLIPQLKELKRRIISQRYWEKAGIEISMTRIQELADQYTWFFKTDSISNEKRIDHILNNPYHKNKVIHYNMYQLNENIWDASLIRTSSVALLWEIMNLKESEQTKSIELFLDSLNLNPFEEKKCQDMPYSLKDELNMRLNYIFYNNRNTPISYNLVSENGEKLNKRSFVLPSKTFRLYETDLNSSEFIEILDDNECSKIYGRSREDYLVIN